MKKIDFAWLAGFIDGEGSFCLTYISGTNVRSPKIRPVIRAGNTNLNLLLNCARIAGGKVHGPYDHNHWGKNRKPQYMWELKNIADIKKTIYLIFPFLVSKRKQAQILLTIIETFGKYGRHKLPKDVVKFRMMLRLAIKALNHKGTTAISRNERQALMEYNGSSKLVKI